MLRIVIKSVNAHKRRVLATCSAVLLGVAFLAGTLEGISVDPAGRLELADRAERTPDRSPRVGHTLEAALGAFARAWLTRLPLATDDPHAETRLGRDLLSEVQADEQTRRPFAQLLALDALLLGLALEHVREQFVPRPPRHVRVADAVLTMLHGPTQPAAAAPGHRACP